METTQFKKVTKTFVYSCVLAIGIALFGGATAFAASLYLSPSNGSYNVGSNIVVGIYVTSTTQAMNAVSGTLTFPRDRLELTSLSKTSSIMSLWVQEPSFSNANGTATFEGIVLNPGFIGSAGKIITANFKVKAQGTAPVIFSSGSVLANDGVGTNILTNLGNANFTLGAGTPSVPTPTTPVDETGTLKAPTIISSTHPDSDSWYTKTDAIFSWQLPLGTTGVRLLVGRNPTSTPTVTYVPAITSKELTDFDDGIWYFHARLRNAQGYGESAHFKFQIDTEKPDRFDITVVEREDPTTPTAKFVFDANDATSGIDYYEVAIDNGEAKQWRDDGTRVYETEILSPGEHTIVVNAIDRAGNFLTNSADFTVKALDAPVITEYPKTITTGEKLVVRGTTYPNIQVTLWLERANPEILSQVGTSDENGNFAIEYEEKLKVGAYSIWVDAIDERGAKSDLSQKVTISVERGPFLNISTEVIGTIAAIIPIIILLVLLAFLGWLGWYVFISLRKRLHSEVGEAEEALHKAIDLLKDEIRDQLKLLGRTKTKKQLTRREERVLERLRQDLDDAERFIKKEIMDIEREIDNLHIKKKKEKRKPKK